MSLFNKFFYLVCFFSSFGANVYAADIEIFKLQTSLHEMGYDAGPIDGQQGRRTSAALEEFAQSQNIVRIDEEYFSIVEALYEAHAQRFNQVVTSSQDCDFILGTKVRRFGTSNLCMVVGRLEFQSEHRGPVWGFPFYLGTRIGTNGNVELIGWAADEPVKQGEVFNGLGRAHLFQVNVNLERAMENNAGPLLDVPKRQLPISIRRASLSDTDNDGLDELVLIANREDGRGPSNNWLNGFRRNLTDYNYIYDFENAAAIRFGKATFSHDFGIADIDNDGTLEILDLALASVGGRRVFYVCNGRTLICKWQASNHFEGGRSSVRNEVASGKTIMFAHCGRRYNNEQNIAVGCWFELSYREGAQNPVTFRLVSKFQFTDKYDTQQTFLNFVQEKVQMRGWKIEGESPSQAYVMGARGYHSELADLDGDGDLDTAVYESSNICRKLDTARNYYTYEDCEEQIKKIYVFLQENGEFGLSRIYDISDETVANYLRFNVEDLDGDGLVDIHSYVFQGGCIDHLTGVLRGLGQGEFAEFDRNKIMGTYGCEIASDFFEYEGEKYRFFLSRKSNNNSPEVYLAVEYIGQNLLNVLPKSNICRFATELEEKPGGELVSWSSTDDTKVYREFAESNGWSCDVGSWASITTMDEVCKLATVNRENEFGVQRDWSNYELAFPYRDFAETQGWSCDVGSWASITTTMDEVCKFATVNRKTEFGVQRDWSNYELALPYRVFAEAQGWACNVGG